MRQTVLLFALAASLSCNIFGTQNVLAGPDVVFTSQPSDAKVAAVISPAVRVELHNVRGERLDTHDQPIVLNLQDGVTGAILSGTVSRSLVGGVAVFDDLKVDRASANYRLRASSGGLSPQSALSAQFTITP